MLRWEQKQKGFTIVELLIVIVVIAILAAITIVAYNGIQARSENTKTINSINAYAKAVHMYAGDQGLYPALNYPCLGKVSYCANMTDTAGGCEGSGRASASAPLNTALSTMALSLPEPSSQAMDCNGKQYSGAYYYYTNAGKNAGIRYYLKGNVDCPQIGGLSTGTRYQNSDTTTCAVAFPGL